MSHSPDSLHIVGTYASLEQTEVASLDRQQYDKPEQVLQGRSEFPDHDTDLYFKPFVVSVPLT